MPSGGVPLLVGAGAVAEAFKGRAQAARSAVLDGVLGVVVAPDGRTLLVLEVAIEDGRIVEIDAVADPERLAALRLRGRYTGLNTTTPELAGLWPLSPPTPRPPRPYSSRVCS